MSHVSPLTSHVSNRWYRRRVTIALLRQLGITGTYAQRAVEDMAAAPMYFIDGSVVPAEAVPQRTAPSTRSRQAGGRQRSTAAAVARRPRQRNWEGSSSEEEEEEEDEMGDYSEEDDGDGKPARGASAAIEEVSVRKERGMGDLLDELLVLLRRR